MCSIGPWSWWGDGAMVRWWLGHSVAAPMAGRSGASFYWMSSRDSKTSIPWETEPRNLKKWNLLESHIILVIISACIDSMHVLSRFLSKPVAMRHHWQVILSLLAAPVSGFDGRPASDGFIPKRTNFVRKSTPKVWPAANVARKRSVDPSWWDSPQPFGFQRLTDRVKSPLLALRHCGMWLLASLFTAVAGTCFDHGSFSQEHWPFCQELQSGMMYMYPGSNKLVVFQCISCRFGFLFIDFIGSFWCLIICWSLICSYYPSVDEKQPLGSDPMHSFIPCHGLMLAPGWWCFIVFLMVFLWMFQVLWT
jgi:hypothetical protein